MRTRIFRGRAGFTLIEVMTVMVIAVVVSGVSIPVLGNIYKTFRLRTSADALAGELQLAKMKAILTNATVTLTITANSSSYQLTGEATRYLYNSVTFSGNPPGTISFDSRGRLVGASVVAIVLAGTNNTTATVTIHPSGRVYVS